MSIPSTTVREPLSSNPNGTTTRTFPLLRRKASNPSFPQFASSEETKPSTHPSIYDASAHPSTDSLGLATSLAKAADDLAWLQGVDPVHKPHRLDAITEKNSRSTLVTQRSVSVGGKGAISSKGTAWGDGEAKTQMKGVEGMAWLVGTKQPGITSAIPSSMGNTLSTAAVKKPNGHRRSYTAPLPEIRSSRFSEILSSDESPPPVYNIFPKRPHRAPLHRENTPPGLPTFNTPAAQRYVLPRPPLRLRDYVKRDSPRREYKRQTHRLPPGAVMRGEGGILVRGRWRAGVSGHTGREIGRQDMRYRTAATPNPRDRPVPEVRESVQSGWRKALKGLKDMCLCTPPTADEVPEQPVRMRSSRRRPVSGWVGRGRWQAEEGAAVHF